MSQYPPLLFDVGEVGRQSMAGRARQSAGIRITSGTTRDSADKSRIDAYAIPIICPIVGITTLSLGSQYTIPCVELLFADPTVLCNVKSRTRVALWSLAILCAKRRNAFLRMLWSR